MCPRRFFRSLNFVSRLSSPVIVGYVERVVRDTSVKIINIQLSTNPIITLVTYYRGASFFQIKSTTVGLIFVFIIVFALLLGDVDINEVSCQCNAGVLGDRAQ